MAACFLTTLDNPYDYFTQFDEWYAFDTAKGYNTCSYLARISFASTEMSEKDYEDAIEAAVDEALRLNITGNYRKVVEKKSKSEDEDDDEDESEEIDFEEESIE